MSSREQLRVDTEGKEKLFDRKSKSISKCIVLFRSFLDVSGVSGLMNVSNFYQIVFLCLPYLRAVALLKTPYLSPSKRGSMQNFNSLYVCVSLEETDTRSNLGRRSLGTRRTDSSSS